MISWVSRELDMTGYWGRKLDHPDFKKQVENQRTYLGNHCVRHFEIAIGAVPMADPSFVKASKEWIESQPAEVQKMFEPLGFPQSGVLNLKSVLTDSVELGIHAPRYSTYVPKENCS